MLRSVFIFVIILLLNQTLQAGVLLQGFYWDAPSPSDETWWDKLAKESKNISESGFTSVWIPPVLKGASGGYSNGYDPYDDYDLGSKDQRDTYGTHWGTREQLMRMVGMMRANGMDVYFDNVLGHRSGDDGKGHFVYKDAYGQSAGGRFQKSDYDFSGFNSFGRQLNYFNPYTQNHLIQAGDWLVNALGVQGQRIDMATNVAPEFLRKYLDSGAMSNQFAVSEYWSENLDELEHYVVNQMQGRVRAFDFPLWGRLKDLSNAGGFYDLRNLINAGLNSRQPKHAVTFVENHDTDRGFPMTQNKHLAYAFILTTEGYPSVFWKDYYNYGLKKIIDPLIWVHEKFAHGPLEWRHTEFDLLIYERKSKPGLLAGLNDNQTSDKSQWVQTDFGPFVTLHDYTGNAPDIQTQADGRVEVRIPSNSYVAYAPKDFHWGHETKSFRTHQQFAGAKDLDIPPATKDKFQTVGRIYVEKNTFVDWNLYLNSSLQASVSKDAKLILISEHQGDSCSEFLSPTYKNDGSVTYQASTTGWYEFQIKLNKNSSADSIPYWLNVNYQSPKSF